MNAEISDLCPERAREFARVATLMTRYHVVMVGAPGVGKTMIARRLRHLLPPLTDRAERWQLAAIQYWGRGGPSWATETRLAPRFGRRPPNPPEIVDARPVRMPHHTCSPAGLLGGHARYGGVRPGEATLAHGGILYLDELPEFSAACIYGVAAALDDRHVAIVRAAGVVQLPAAFRLAAGMTPCPCGFRGHPRRGCLCSARAVNRWIARARPILSRPDVVTIEIGGTTLTDAGMMPGQVA